MGLGEHHQGLHVLKLIQLLLGVDLESVPLLSHPSFDVIDLPDGAVGLLFDLLCVAGRGCFYLPVRPLLDLRYLRFHCLAKRIQGRLRYLSPLGYYHMAVQGQLTDRGLAHHLSYLGFQLFRSLTNSPSLFIRFLGKGIKLGVPAAFKVGFRVLAYRLHALYGFGGLLGELLFLEIHSLRHLSQGPLPGRSVNAGNGVLSEVQDPLQRSGRDIQQKAKPARSALHIPDVTDWRRQTDVAHPFSSNLGPSDFNAAPVADYALVTDSLVLSAVAFEVFGRTEGAFAEEAILLRLQCPVVDGLGLGHFSVGPL